MLDFTEVLGDLLPALSIAAVALAVAVVDRRSKLRNLRAHLNKTWDGELFEAYRRFDPERFESFHAYCSNSIGSNFYWDHHEAIETIDMFEERFVADYLDPKNQTEIDFHRRWKGP